MVAVGFSFIVALDLASALLGPLASLSGNRPLSLVREPTFVRSLCHRLELKKANLFSDKDKGSWFVGIRVYVLVLFVIY